MMRSPGTFSIFFLTLFLSGCSFYSSAGRKQFEEKAPSQIVQPQGFQLLGCRQLTAAEAWWKEEFPSTDTEIVELTPQHEVWSRTALGGEVEVTVFSKSDSEVTESCRYMFSSVHSWQSQKENFLAESNLANTLENPRENLE